MSSDNGSMLLRRQSRRGQNSGTGFGSSPVSLVMSGAVRCSTLWERNAEDYRRSVLMPTMYRGDLSDFFRLTRMAMTYSR
jgi:hypothetical protein